MGKKSIAYKMTMLEFLVCLRALRDLLGADMYLELKPDGSGKLLVKDQIYTYWKDWPEGWYEILKIIKKGKDINGARG